MKRKNDRLPGVKPNGFILSENSSAALREAYRSARTNLDTLLEASRNKTVVFTSCSPSEGKSTSCLNMALTMAEAGTSVLLIDCDMRKPVQHSLLCIDNETGLSSVLGGKIPDPAAAIERNVRENLDVLTAGPVPPDPSELISGARMDDLLRLVGERYDYVLIDTPPVKAVTDAVLIGGKVSGIVFVVKEEHTRHEDIRDALDKVKMANGRVLGLLRAGCCKRKRW